MVEIAGATLGACAITYRPLFNWVFRTQSSPSGPERKPTLAGRLKLSRVNTRTGLVANIGTNIKMQTLNVFHPSLPAPFHRSPMSKTEDGFRRILESTEV